MCFWSPTTQLRHSGTVLKENSQREIQKAEYYIYIYTYIYIFINLPTPSVSITVSQLSRIPECKTVFGCPAFWFASRWGDMGRPWWLTNHGSKINLELKKPVPSCLWKWCLPISRRFFFGFFWHVIGFFVFLCLPLHVACCVLLLLLLLLLPLLVLLLMGLLLLLLSCDCHHPGMVPTLQPSSDSRKQDCATR